MSPASREAHNRSAGDGGAVLILALVFLLAIGIVTLAISNFAVAAAVNTTNLRAERTVSVNVESAAMVAIQQVRRGYVYPGQTAATTNYSSNPSAPPAAVSCLPPTVVSTVNVYCIGFSNAGTALTRIVDFYVCASAVTAAACTQTAPLSSSVALYAEVAYDDIPPGELPSSSACTATTSATCGMTMTIDHWDVRLSDS